MDWISFMTAKALTTFETIVQAQALLAPDEALVALADQASGLFAYAEDQTTTDEETASVVNTLFAGFDRAVTLVPDTLEGIKAMARLLAFKATIEETYDDPVNALSMALLTALGATIPAVLPAGAVLL